MNDAQMAEIDKAYRELRSMAALRMAPQLQRFYQTAHARMNNPKDLEAAIDAIRVVGPIDNYFGILETQTIEPYKEHKRFYFSQSLDIQRSQHPLVFVACFPGPSPDFLRGKVPNDNTEQYRILLKGRNEKKRVARSIPLLGEGIDNLVRDFSLLL